jgi:hypothetical protein
MAITFGNFTENVSLPLDTQYLVGYDTISSGGERRTTLATLKQAFYLNGVTSNIQTQLNNKQGSLGFTPVQQGGGTGQGTNKVYVGWLGSTLGLQIDSTNFSNTWPISITGNAATAGTCTGNAATATKLVTARTINGVSFDGTADITIATGGGGTVTNVTASSPLTVTNGTTTPSITLGAIPPSLGGAGGLTGVLKASSGTVSVAIAGTDFQAVITGAASTIASSNLTTNKALVSDASGKVHSSVVTDTELGYVGGVTSAIQTQLNGKLSSTGNAATATKLVTARTINGVSFDGTGNITIPATASGANVAKAWVSFNGNTVTITPRANYNVSSVTKTGQGYFTINFTTPLTDANYVILGSAELDNGTNLTSGAMVGTNFTITPTVNAASIYVIGDDGSLRNSFYTHVAIFGN